MLSPHRCDVKSSGAGGGGWQPITVLVRAGCYACAWYSVMVICCIAISSDTCQTSAGMSCCWECRKGVKPNDGELCEGVGGTFGRLTLLNSATGLQPLRGT